MNLFKKTFLSMGSAIVLFMLFAIASAAATILEKIYSTQVAWMIVYGAGWFALIQLLLGINLAYNIYAYKLINIKKLPSLLFHLSFIVILIGAGITRYFGFEGNMHIRENDRSNTIATLETFVTLSTNIDGKEYQASVPRAQKVGQQPFDVSLDLPDGSANLKFVRYVPKAGFEYGPDPKGKAVMELVISNNNGDKQETDILDGEEVLADDLMFLLNTDVKDYKKYVKFSLDENGSSFISSDDVVVFDGSKKTIKAGEKIQIDKAQLYTIGNLNFNVKFASPKASRQLQSVNDSEFDAIIAELSHKDKKEEVVLFYNLIETSKSLLDGKLFVMSWGSRDIKLPFSLYLKDFELKRYPGSNSPMGYSSDVLVEDSRTGTEPFEYRIFMNHVLDYDGYRFFQSSYDQDERGTILSVNKDPGKIPTYIGYFLLGLGFLLNVINPGSRFRKLAKLIDADSAKKVVKNGTKAAIVALACLFGLGVSDARAQDFYPHIDKDHAAKLSEILVQSQDGRMKPFDTISKEILNKIHRKDSIGSLNSNQAMLSIMLEPDFWQTEPIIALGSSVELKKELGIDPSKKFASFNDFFAPKDGKNEYKLELFVDKANRKHPGSRGTFDKDVIKIDERINIFYIGFIGEAFRVFPKLNDPSNSWSSPYSAMMSFPPEESNAVATMMKNYFTAVGEAMTLGKQNSSNSAEYADKWRKADHALEAIKEYQTKHGSAIIPSKSRVTTEIKFNEFQIFERLTPIYLLAGFVLLMFVFVKMLAPRVNIGWIVKIIYVINILAFVVHTAGLGLRWYISEHAPWSNSYESMIYIAWALGLSGIVFSKRSPIAIALTSILAGITLFVAHLSWMDPQITTLVPVLQSYWLTIHVSVITASYGFLGLCALLGFFVLVLICLQSGKTPNPEILRNITEATRINEMAMILGLSLLTLGNFLGGVWANESWGRYWGWDSKETWALISILVYAAVLHMRFVPRLNSQYAFAVASSFAYWSIIMTYFGVNFYLAGMHSYASGDPLPVPNFIYVILGVMTAVSVFAYFKRQSCTRL